MGTFTLSCIQEVSSQKTIQRTIRALESIVVQNEVPSKLETTATLS